MIFPSFIHNSQIGKYSEPKIIDNIFNVSIMVAMWHFNCHDVEQHQDSLSAWIGDCLGILRSGIIILALNFFCLHWQHVKIHIYSVNKVVKPWELCQHDVDEQVVDYLSVHNSDHEGTPSISSSIAQNEQQVV